MNQTDKVKIIERINKVFVDDYDVINSAKDKINDYIDTMSINGKYGYNEFCKVFIEMTDDILDILSIEEFSKIPVDVLISEILALMLKKKIISSEQADETKTSNLLKLEMDKFKITKK